MTRFILYLFETGLCLSLLYLAYWLFLKKETYFNFNRLFLVGSILLALSVPLLHLSITIPLNSSLKDPAERIVKFRDYYEELIYMSEEEFGREPTLRDEQTLSGNQNVVYEGRYPAEKISNKRIGRGNISFASILVSIYILGVLYFLIRFIYLVARLYIIAYRTGFTRQDGFRMVQINEDISPFSFFRFLFINSKSFENDDLQQVLEHEKAHIIHRHSMDHLFAHGLAIFQWFNPFAWQIRTALKTTHEYIADRQVLKTGVEPVDYQTLLLRQVIAYHSVELVNNFNLKPIKKRIAMMSKKRSGMPAKMKALLVIPFALIAFIFFADFTLKGPGNRILDIRSAEYNMNSGLNGVWVKLSEDDFSKMIHFDKDRFSYQDNNGIKEYFWSVNDGQLNLATSKGSKGINLKIEESGNILSLWWNDQESTEYKRTGAENTMDAYFQKCNVDISLPGISQFKFLDNQKLLTKICIANDKSGNTFMTLNGKEADLEKFKELVMKEKQKVNKLDVSKQTIMFMIDRDVSMSEVTRLKSILREIGSLKVAYAGYPEGPLAVSALQYHTVALPMVLPPMDAKLIDKEDVEKQGTKIFTIDHVAKNLDPAKLDRELEQFIRENEKGKYVMSHEYDGSTSYGVYLETVDIVFNVVYRFRKDLAMKKYQVPYSQLGHELQKEIRKEYPMVLSEAWSGN